MSLLAMAKKKPGPKPTEGVGRTVPTTVRSTEAWKAWLDELAEHDGDARRSNASISDTIDRALVAYARQIGFQKMPPKR